MELYIQIIFVLALAKFCLKAAMTGRFWTMACYAFFAALVSLALYPTVIEQPATVITNLLADRELVTDGAVLTTTEAILGIFVSVFLLSNYFKPKGQRRKSVFVLKVVPGILWIFAVAYFELLFFVGQNTAIYIENMAIDGIRCFGCKEYGRTGQFLRSNQRPAGVLAQMNVSNG